MKTKYKGFILEAKREMCLGGYKMAYFNAARESDGLELICSYSEGEDHLRDFIKQMKEEIDGFLKEEIK